jgi:D-xylose transport system permease protein
MSGAVSTGGAPTLFDRIGARLKHGELGPIPVLVGLVVIAIVFQSLNPNFLTPRNISNLILQIGVVGTVACGVVLALLLGEIDLSLGAVAGVAASVMGIVLTQMGWPGWAGILAAIGTGMLLGLLQGLIVVFLRVPAFIATLAGLLAWQGVQLIVLGPQGERIIRDPLVRGIATTYLPPQLGWLVGGLIVLAVAAVIIRARARRRRAQLPLEPASQAVLKLAVIAALVSVSVAGLNAYFGIPLILLLLGGLVALLTWFTERSTTGRHIYAIGGNPEAARRAGIPVAAVRIGVFALVAAIAGWAGVISASRQFAVSIGTGGGTLLLDAIAAAVIGGTSLFGGRGRVYNAILGAVVIGSVANGLDLLGSPSSIKNIATGAILVAAVAIDALSRTNRQGR